MPRKTNSKAFEQRHPQAAKAVEQWMFDADPRLDSAQAAQRLQSEFGLRYSAEAMRTFWHRISQRRLLERISANAQKANAVVARLEENQSDTYRAVMNLVGQAALDAVTANESLDVEALAELTKLMISGRKEQLRAEALQFDREKYKESLRTKTDVALDAFAEFLKGQPALMEKFNALRAEVKAVMS